VNRSSPAVLSTVMSTRISYRAVAVVCGLLLALVAGSARSAAVSPQTATPAFDATIAPISDTLAEEMRGVSWRAGCPVAISDLRLITMNHWGFDGAAHDGELVVHAAVADDIVEVFRQLFAARFPIKAMQRIERYAGDDEASMEADNTSAFNCRQITGGGAFSKHAWGMAVDINPVENPYVRDGRVLPPAGATFLDRGDHRAGMIVAGDVVTTAMAAIGFDWGGDWNRLQDYQHFEVADPAGRAQATGRSCPDYSEHPGTYPVKLCHSGQAVTGVQQQLVRHGYDVDVDGYFGPQTLAAIQRFQRDHGLEVDGLVGPLTWSALVACADQVPSSAAWSGDAFDLTDRKTGVIDVAPFNEFRASAGSDVAATPCDAARVLLHLDRPFLDGETVDVAVSADSIDVVGVTVTIGRLADDSIEAVRYQLRFERDDAGFRLAAGTWAQRCQPGRGHQDFSTELCV